MLVLIKLVYYVIEGLEMIIILAALMSWLPGATDSKLGRIVNRIAGLIVDPVRRIMPRTSFIDFPPLVAILLLQAAQLGLTAIVRVLIGGY